MKPASGPGGACGGSRGNQRQAASTAPATRAAAVMKASRQCVAGKMNPPSSRPPMPPVTVAETYQPITTLRRAGGSVRER
jgi:hypothetical protein